MLGPYGNRATAAGVRRAVRCRWALLVCLVCAACSSSSPRARPAPSTSTSTSTTAGPVPQVKFWDSIIATQHGVWAFAKVAGTRQLARLDTQTAVVDRAVIAPIDALDTEIDGVVWGHTGREVVGFDYRTL